MIKVAVQALEIALGISVALLLGKTIYSVLVDTTFFENFQSLFESLGLLVGEQNIRYIYLLCMGAILILVARWFLSWLSTDSQSRPNS